MLLNINKKSFITISLLITIIFLIYLEFNTKYSLLNNFPIIHNKKSKGLLYIISHNFEHKDILITFKLFSKKNEKYYMLFANKNWNYLLEPLRPKNIEFIYIKEKTVDLISSKLLLGENVIMFLYEESTSTGPYYILKNTKSPLIIIKIKNSILNKINYNHFNYSLFEIYCNNFLSTFIVDIKKIKYKSLLLFNNKNVFIKQLKNIIYN